MNSSSNLQPVSSAGGRLSAMMFLEFFVWGTWYVSMTGFINKTGMQGLTAAAYTVGPIAAILSPFFLGLVADRFFATQRVLGVMHILGGAALAAAPWAAAPYDPKVGSAFAHPFILLLLTHMLCYMPTLGLTSSISFHNLRSGEKGFPLVRVFGTIGWIAGNLVVSRLPGQDASAAQFHVAGGAGILLGLYAFTLPHTPPPLTGKSVSIAQILGLDALQLFRSRSYAVFILCSFLLCIPLAGYYAFARNYVEAAGAVVNGSATFTMSFGQMSEIFFMLVMPLCFARLGVKWMLAVGMLAWVARYGLFAGAAADKTLWMILAGVVLHGVCYDFFFVSGMIYVDKAAPQTIRGQAQGFLVLVTQGVGMLIGAQVFGRLVAHYSTAPDGSTAPPDWRMIWLIPCAAAAAILILFIVLFRERGPSDVTGTPPHG
jgi:nucleoside transporter